MTNELKILNTIFDFLCQETYLKPHQIRSRVRQRPLAMARFTFYYLCRTYNPTLTLTAIGAFLMYDHATVINGINRIESLMSVDKKFKKQMGYLCAKYLSEVHPSILQKISVKPYYSEIQSYKLETNRVTEQANKMYYESMIMLNKVLDNINQDNNMEGYRKARVNNQSASFKNKMKLLKMGLSV